LSRGLDLAVLKAVSDYGPLSVEEALDALQAVLGVGRDEAARALRKLEEEGLVSEESGVLRVTERGLRVLGLLVREGFRASQTRL
jgi:Mn-dependent DtxR family transcriptional regulator